MTKEEILEMKTGEELDRLVATEVMREPMPKFTPPNALELQLAGSPVKSPQGNWLSRCKYSESDIPIWRPLPYSTDISAAWQLVGKMRESDRYNFDRMEKGYKDKGQFDATFIDFCSEIMEVLGIKVEEYSYAASLMIMRKLSPEAICKAALLAKYSQ